MKKQLITHFFPVDPDSSHNTTTGYSIGQNWVNTATGDRWYYKNNIPSTTTPVWVKDLNTSNIPDATTTTKGIVKLAGDLGGTADLPTVPNKTEWRGLWNQTEYLKNQQVLDDGYLAIANKTTSEKPAPQKVGDPFNLYQGTAMAGVVENAKQILFGNQYTFKENVFLEGWRINVVVGNRYTVYLVRDPGILPHNNVISQIIQFVAQDNGWVNLALQSLLIEAGNTYALIAAVMQPNATTATFEGSWRYTQPQNTTIPQSGEITQPKAQPYVLYISDFDNAGTNRRLELDDLAVGDTIKTSNTLWSIQSISPQIGYINVTVSPALLTLATTPQTFTFETKGITPLTYPVDPLYWDPATFNSPYADVEGLFGVDTSFEDIAHNTNAYGIGVLLQAASISADWDIQAFSGGGGGSGGGASTLDQLTDVEAPTPANNEILVYDFATKLWKNKPNSVSGTVNTVPKFITANSIGNSSITDSGMTGSGLVNINNFIRGDITRTLPSGDLLTGQRFYLTQTDATSRLSTTSIFNWNEDGVANTAASPAIFDIRCFINKTTNQPGSTYLAGQFQIAQQNSGTAGVLTALSATMGPGGVGVGTGTVSQMIMFATNNGPIVNNYPITTYIGLNLNFTPQNNVTNAYGVRVAELYGTGLSRAFESTVSAGTGKWNIYANGTAANHFNGNVLIGTATNGTEKLQIAGYGVATGWKVAGTVGFLKSDGTVDTTTTSGPVTIMITTIAGVGLISTGLADANGVGQNGKNVVINNASALTITCDGGVTATYARHSADGLATPPTITFQAGVGPPARTLIPVDGTLTFNGAPGSTAALWTAPGTTIDYIRINNA